MLFINDSFKISNGNITNTLLFFVEKMGESFALQRILAFFQNNSVLVFEVDTVYS